MKGLWGLPWFTAWSALVIDPNNAVLSELEFVRAPSPPAQLLELQSAEGVPTTVGSGALHQTYLSPPINRHSDPTGKEHLLSSCGQGFPWYLPLP